MSQSNQPCTEASRQTGKTETQVPVASGRGESGRDSVGDGVPTAKLLLLLLRELWVENSKQESDHLFYAVL